MCSVCHNSHNVLFKVHELIFHSGKKHSSISPSYLLMVREASIWRAACDGYGRVGGLSKGAGVGNENSNDYSMWKRAVKLFWIHNLMVTAWNISSHVCICHISSAHSLASEYRGYTAASFKFSQANIIHLDLRASQLDLTNSNLINLQIFLCLWLQGCIPAGDSIHENLCGLVPRLRVTCN